MSLQVQLGKGETKTVASDKNWRVEKTAPEDWRKVDFDDSQWKPALVTARFGEGPWGRIGNAEQIFAPYALGISDQLRIVYALAARPVRVSGLRPKAKYRFTEFDPVTGGRSKPVEVTTDTNGHVHCPAPTHGHDWVAVLERK